MAPGLSPRMFIRKGKIIKTVIADGSGDHKTLSAALAAITDASASKPYGILVFGKIADTVQSVAKEYVDVFGIDADITSTLVNDAAVLFSGVGNTRWQNLIFRRSGTPTTGSLHPVVLFTGNGCNTTCIVRDCRFLNEVNANFFGLCGGDVAESASPIIDRCTFSGGVSGYAYGHNNGLNITDANTAPLVKNSRCIGGTSTGADYGCEIMFSASPRLENNTYVGGSGASGQNRALVIAHGTSHSAEPIIMGGIAIGGSYSNGDGLQVRDDSAPVIIGLTAKPGTGAQTSSVGASISYGAYPTIIGGYYEGSEGVFSGSHGVLVNYGAAPTFRGSVIRSGKYGDGVYIVSPGSMPRFFNCTIRQYGIYADCHAVNVASGGAIFDGCQMAPSIMQAPITTPYDNQMWTNADNGRFRPLASYPYQIISMAIGIDVGYVGQTFDLGTTAGDDDILADIDLGATGNYELPINLAVAQIVASGYIYGTPSGTVLDNHIGFKYSYCRNQTNNCGVYLNSNGSIQIRNSTILAAGASDALYIGANAIASPNYRIERCTIENFNPAANAINAASEISNAPIYQSTFRGLQTNIASCLAGTAVGTNISL